MGEWNRSTRECRLEDLSPAVNAAIQKHLEQYNLGSILNDALLCVETTSESKKKGLFGLGRAEVVLVHAVLTPAWLVWVVTTGSASTALSARIQDIVVTDYADSPSFKLLPDTGVQVEGILTGHVGMHGNQTVGMFIGLGEESAALRFKRTLSDLVRQTRRP
jgi:hypothetical protein